VDAAKVPLLCPFAIALTLHDAATNVIGAIRDMDGDRRGGYVTAPVKYGVRASLWLALGLGAGAFAICLRMSSVWNHPAPGRYALLLLAAVLFAAAALYGIIGARMLSRTRALAIHNVLIVERLALACGLIAIPLGLHGPAALFVAAAVLTVIAQVHLRGRYEFGAAAVPLTQAGFR
jgi:4-hydroxybenzoate polyprenyltransferase/geranylgeranylglycerol-phosphate geranylgeranyltransferase